MAPSRSRHLGVNVVSSTSSMTSRRAAQSGLSAGTGRESPSRIVASKLRHHCSAESRTDRSTIASRWASASPAQNAHAGQSTVAVYPAGKVCQSGGSPRTAACQRGTSSGRSNTSIMW